MDGLLEPIMYLVLVFCILGIRHLLRRRLWWDAPAIVIMVALAGGALYSISQGERGLLVAAITMGVGFLLAEVSGRIGKRVMWARLQGNTASALFWCRIHFLLPPTAYKYAMLSLLKLMRQVELGRLDDKEAQRKLQAWEPYISRINSMSMSLLLWEALYAFIGHKGEWARLARNFNPEMLPVYSHPPSGAGYWMIRALCEQGKWAQASFILQAMEDASQVRQMVPEESDAFHNKARLVYLAYRGDDQTVVPLLQPPSSLALLFSKEDRKHLESIAKRSSPPTQSFVQPSMVSAFSAMAEMLSNASTPKPNGTLEASEDAEEDFDEEDEAFVEPVFFDENIDQEQLSVRVREKLDVEALLSYDFSLWGNSTFTTRLLLGLNVLVFLVVSITGERWGMGETLSLLNSPTTNPMLLLQFGGGHIGLFAVGEPWRLLSATFLHAGLMHLLFNSYFLLFFGPTVERLLGSWRFFNVYMLSGLGGFLAAFAVGTDKVIVGASASIFGVFGATIVAVWMLRDRLPYRWYRRQLVVCILLLVLNSYLGVAIKAISFSAHTGGMLVGGLLTLLLLHPRFPAAIQWKRAGIATTLVIWISVSTWTVWNVYRSSQNPLPQRLSQLATMKERAVPLFQSFFAYTSIIKRPLLERMQILQATEGLGLSATPVVLLAMRDRNPQVVREAEQRLHKFGKQAFPAIIRSLHNEDPEVRLMAAEVLGSSTWPRAKTVTALYRKRNEKNSVVQTVIFLSLQQHKFAGLSVQQRGTILKSILNNANDDRAWTRRQSLRLLGTIKIATPEVLNTLRGVVLGGPSNNERHLAGYTLLKLGPQGRRVLQQLAESSRSDISQLARLLLRTSPPPSPSQR
ncbi:MAG: rhomboid family intramembrane serine protease [Deltaproteobacteria bacterium]|nr:MAG: rhomboid family intramembrane serine protease [Deltaproteobacteria bacterium]